MTLLGARYDSEVPYDMPVVIDVTLAHNRTTIPSSVMYYAYLANGTTSLGGWRILGPESALSDPQAGVTIYKFSLPSSNYNESFQYGARIVSYVEAIDLEGHSLLSARPSDRWDPLVQDDKFVVEITDPYPPTISQPTISPSPPTSNDPVTVVTNVFDQGSGVGNVLLFYSAGDSPQTVLVMNGTDSGTYQATIPPFDAGTKVVLFVRAFDNAGNRISRSTSYVVTATIQANPFLIAGIVGAIVVLGILGIWVMRKRLRGVGALVQRQSSHPKAMTVLLGFIVTFSACLYYQLLTQGAALLGLVQAGALILGWGLIDPRVDILFPLKRSFDEMPPIAIIAEAYILSLASAFSLGAGYLLGIYSTVTAYVLALGLAPYILFLLLSGIVLQLAWPYVREMDISIEIEPNDLDQTPSGAD
jgi:hypothetical protein